VRRRLPFPALVVCSDDDPYCDASRALAMATDWGAAVDLLTGAGHINAESGLGDWPAGLERLAALGR
jgi:predicted alpha/beta hydrolase family esterase